MFRFNTAGESHGRALVAIVEGLPAGLAVDAQQINRELERRQWGYGRGGRMKIERDRAEVLSGVRHGLTLGSPVTLFRRASASITWPAMSAWGSGGVTGSPDGEMSPDGMNECDSNASPCPASTRQAPLRSWEITGTASPRALPLLRWPQYCGMREAPCDFAVAIDFRHVAGRKNAVEIPLELDIKGRVKAPPNGGVFQIRVHSRKS